MPRPQPTTLHRQWATTLWRQVTFTAIRPDSEEGRLSRLLSGAIVIVIIVGAISEAEYLSRTGQFDYLDGLTFFALALLALAFGLNRRGYFRAATVWAISTIALSIYAIFGIVLVDEGVVETDILFFLIAPILMSEFFLPLRAYGVAVALILIGLLGFLAAPGVIDVFWFMAAFSALMGLASYYQRELEQKRQLALRASEERFRAMIESSYDAVQLVDATGHTLYASPANTRILGYSPEEFQPFRALETVHPEDRERASKAWAEILQHPGRAVPLVVRVPHKDGSWRWIQGVGTNLLTKPAVGAIVINYHDITERKLAEEALQASEKNYRELVEQASDGIFITNAEGYYVDVNQLGCQMLGYTREEILRLHIRDLVQVEERERVAPEVANLRQGEAVFSEWLFQRKDGSTFPGEVSAAILSDGRVLGIMRDITARKQTELETKRRADEFAALYDTARDLSQRQNLDELLNTIVGRAARLFQAPNCAINLYDEEHHDLVITATIGSALPIGTRRALGDGLVGRVARTLQPMRVDDYQTWEGRSLSYAGIPYSSIMGVPMLYSGRLIGVLDISEIGPTTRRFTEADLNLLALFATLAAAAVYNARLYEATRLRLSELEAVSRISTALRAAQTPNEALPLLLNETLGVVDSSAGAIWLYDAPTGKLRQAIARGWFTQLDETPLIPGEGVGGAVFATGQIHLTREFANDPMAREATRAQIPPDWGGACLPIRTAAEIVGVLFVAVHLPRELKPGEARLLTTLAEIAGNALHRMRLHAQTEQHVQRLTALRTIDMAITASLDLNITLNILMDQVVAQLRVDAAAVLLLNETAQVLEFAAGRGFRGQAISHTRRRLGEGYAGRAALDRALVTVPDLRQRDSGFLRAALLAGEDFITYYGAPLIAKGKVKGVLELFQRTPFTPDTDWLEFLETLTGQAAIAIDDAELFNRLQRSNAELNVAYDTTIEGWSRALDLRDKETEGHSQRVTDMTLQLARAVGMHEADLVHVRRGALLHDIGKMGVPDSILLKPGTLTDEEWVIMKKHPVYAYEMLAPILYLRQALDIPYCHHEKWDGSGYPRGLMGETIPLAARIFAVVDVWDALRSDRPYRLGWPAAKVRDYIHALAGIHFDAHITEMFLRLVDDGPAVNLL